MIKRANPAAAGKAAGGKQLAIGGMFIGHLECRINHIITKLMLAKPLADAKLRATLPAVASRLRLGKSVIIDIAKRLAACHGCINRRGNVIGIMLIKLARCKPAKHVAQPVLRTGIAAKIINCLIHQSCFDRCFCHECEMMLFGYLGRPQNQSDWPYAADKVRRFSDERQKLSFAPLRQIRLRPILTA
jgi:hypothetical protein